ncbi:VanZ family protein [Marinobacter sp. 1Y8]
MTQLFHRFTRMTALWRLALIGSMLVILWLATTRLDYPIPASSWDKLNHLIAFIELAILARLSWPRLSPAYAGLAMLAYGLAIEIIQAPLAYREFSLLDLVADGAGVLIGLTLMLWFRPEPQPDH